MKRLITVVVILLVLAPLSPSGIHEFGVISALVQEACVKYGVPVDWALANFWNEHDGLKNNNAKCKYGVAYGPGGMLYKTATEDLGYTGPESGLKNITVSVPLCVKFMAVLMKQYHGDMAKVISHYKTGRPYKVKYYYRVKAIRDALAGC